METEESAGPNEDQRLFVNAQHAIYAIIAKGNVDEKAGHASIGATELINSLALAAAMVIEGNSTTATKRQFREASEHYAKLVRTFAEELRQEADETGIHYLDHIISSITKPH
jgi:hypothetical protein